MGRDKYKYFRVEARELLDGLSRGILELERAPGDRAVVARLLRLAHTLKGAARVVQLPAIAELAHAAEDQLAPHRDEGTPPLPREGIDALLRAVDGMAARLAEVDAPPAAAAASSASAAAGPGATGDAAAAEAPRRAAAGEPPYQSLRVDLPEADALLASALEAGVQAGALRRGLAALGHARELTRALSDQLAPRHGEAEPAPPPARLRGLVDELARALGSVQRSLSARADRAEREIAQLRGAAERLRLVPARAVFGALQRATRDAAHALGREVAFEASGGEVRIDAHLLTPVRDALLHAVRNAVAHGIEPAPERAARGKPPAGRVRVEVERRGATLVFRCRDDGRGVDAEAVRAAAVRKGLATPAEAPALAPAALAALLLRGGLSTSPAVNDLAGRGVGLDVVRDSATRLGGTASLESEPGRGATLELAVPLSLSSVRALHVEAGGAVASVPLEAVERTVHVWPERLAQGPGGAGLSHEGEVLPFLPLGRLLRDGGAERPRRAFAALVVRAGGERVALGADRLLGTSEIVVHPVPEHARAEPFVLGAALDGEGQPRLVLDPAGLAAAARAAAPPPAPRRARAPVLVVDDSLTTRMLQQSILESAGYEVELAVSAEEALDKARRRRFGLFLVDVEMPGMDGFEFVRTTRADPALAVTPAILVTSRAAPEDRRRGLEAGARAYVVKSEFDQQKLLAQIEELLA
ncbi:hybrid sensor histidine kinase/response regulator [Anaeromyxobacter diazotrophicus]|uniref:histidine kinase n=1 Tax=Anaeromyxobacter diazotrophicus TaxID=2590199 RepID=A0A7I9VG90_9BACT|nr:response regulator [Anaeromyxobacter diazotrophicus]GEJ55403.1 hybrid sensor histidine kinase/response regulator [Anaeromyxobacter diazotrophicus]